MHAIERRPNHFRFQARRSRSTPTNFHSSLIHSKPKFRTKSARLDRAPPNYSHEPREKIGSGWGGGRALRLTSDQFFRLEAGSAGSPMARGIPQRAVSSLLRFVKLYPFLLPPHRLFVFHSIRFSIFLHPLFLSFERFVEKGDGKCIFLFFFFRGKLKRNFVVGFVCLRNEECFENKWMECCF